MARWQEQGRGPGDVPLATVRPWMRWQPEGERRLGARLARREGRWRAWASRRGRRSPVARQNGWPRAAVHGAATLEGVQPVLGRARGEAEALRDAGRPSGVAELGGPGGRAGR